MQTREAQVELLAHVSNYMNVITTRTPEGGPYKPWSCANGACTQSSEVLYKYEPDHPDASAEGMVAYPLVNRADEYDGIMAGYAELSILAKTHVCGASLVEAGVSRAIVYGDARSMEKSVTFVLWPDGSVRYVFAKAR